MTSAVFPTVVEIMSGLFSVPAESLNIDSSMETIEQWDSLQHINVILDVEQHFGITMSPEEVMQLHSVQAIVDIVESKLAGTH
jgi:acyl carrier protein